MKLLFFFPLIRFISAAAICFSAASYAESSLTLSHAIDSALACSASLKQAEAQYQMKLAEMWQAGLRINPELSIQLGNGPFDNGISGLNSNDYTIALSQVIEFGGKRSARQNKAAADALVALWEQEIVRKELKEKVSTAVIQLVAATEKVKILKLIQENDQAVLKCIQEKVKNGKASLIQEKQHKLALSAGDLVYKKACFGIESLKHELKALCGEAFFCQGILDYPFFRSFAPLSLKCCHERLRNNPEFSKWQAMLYAAGKEYRLQMANRFTDVKVTAGVVRDSDARRNKTSWLLEMDVALPVFDRNQGNIARASWETWSSFYGQEDLEKQLYKKSASLHEMWMGHFEAVQMLQQETLPEAQELLNIYEEGQAQGKYECLELLVAKKQFYEYQMQLIDALLEFHSIKIQLQSLCGNCF